MFTGIITDKGMVRSVNHQGGDLRIGIKTNFDLSNIDIGASIACAGCCLTVVEKDGDVFFVDVSAESISKTTIGAWQDGTLVNLESALKIGDELGGHIVSGHVDGLVKVKEIMRQGDSHRLTFDVPKDLAGLIASKGSVTLDGVSLTVNEVVNGNAGMTFGVNIIPHTWDQTTLGKLSAGDKVHLEIDMLARYVASVLSNQNK